MLAHTSTARIRVRGLCGACYEVCPVKINIPEVLVHLRREVVRHEGTDAEHVATRTLARVFGNALVELLCEPISEYQAEARRIGPAEVAGAVQSACAEWGLARVAVPPGLPAGG